MPCKAHAGAVRDRLDEFGDAEIAVVTFANPRTLAGYRARFVAPLTVLSDESRATYTMFGFGRGRWWRVWGWRAVRRYVELIRSGRRDIGIDGDTLQLGGDVVIDRSGVISYLFHGAGPDDRPGVDELIAAVRSA
jgi:peroxiredoxin